MASRAIFGWSPPHAQPLTPVSEMSEPPESPLPYSVPTIDPESEVDEEDEIEPLPPAAVPFTALFACADGFDWLLMVVGSLAAAAHGAALVLYVHYFGKMLHLLRFDLSRSNDVLFHNLCQHAVYIIYIASGAFASGWIEVSCWILTGERQTAVIRSKYVKVLLTQDMSFFDEYGNNGDIVSQVLNDVLIIQCALSEKVGYYIHNMATFFIGLVIGFVNCWQISLIAVATIPIIVAAGGLSNIFLHKLAESIQDAYVEAASIAEQAVSYIRALYAFTNETLAKYSYATSLQATLRYGVLISLVQGLGLGFTYGVAMCSCALQLWVGGFLVKGGKANGGEVITAIFAIILGGLGLNQAATNLYSFEQGRIAAYRLYEVIRRSSSVANHDGNTLTSVRGNIEFRNVYFSYPSCPEIPILSGFHLTVPAKKTMALVGRNGSGKSSIIPLLERYYDPTLGEILLDGENINSLKLEWLRNQIGLVTQEPALLSLSIRDNIAYGRPNVTSDQIEEAAKIAHVHAFICSLENGYETQVGRVGLALTEEQKFKVSVARAVLSNPSILLLDEVSGSFDFETERAVQEALDIIMLGRTTIIIARRLSLLSNADYIAVMEGGQLVEVGTHDELLNLEGEYAELLRCQEVVKHPKRLPNRNHKETTLKTENDLSSSNPQDSSFREMVTSINIDNAVLAVQSINPEEMLENDLPLDVAGEALPIERQDSFEMRSQQLHKIDVASAKVQNSDDTNSEFPITWFLTSDLEYESSPPKNPSYLIKHLMDMPPIQEKNDSKSKTVPSFWRLVELSLAEWLYAVLGSAGAAIFGSFNPLLAYVIALIVTTYYKPSEGHQMRYEVNKWCLIIACMGLVTIVANFLQHFYFGIMGEKMTERIRRMMFSGEWLLHCYHESLQILKSGSLLGFVFFQLFGGKALNLFILSISALLHNEIGWFDEKDNDADNLSMRLANDATFVRAAFSNRLSIFVQDSSAVVVALLIGMLVDWRLAFVALATIPVLMVSAVAQRMWLAGFSRGILELHRKASLVLEDAVRNIYTVVAYSAGNKAMELYRLQLRKVYRQSFLHGMAIGLAFGFSRFLLFGCNALLLWYTAFSVRKGYIGFSAALKAYMVFSFSTFALVEPFGLAPYIHKRRSSLSSVFEIIDRVPKIDPDDCSALKPPNVYGTIELKHVDFCYPTRPEVMVLSDFSFKVDGGQTVAVVGVSGSGKSTLISLIERFYDPVAGQIFLDGRDLKLFNLRWLRNQLGLVQQESVIFSTTIRENIIYARHNASEAEMKEAARIANAHHFISSLPHGYDTHVGSRGVDLTPGQKLRIAIARVVLKNAPILLLDEAASGIEFESSRVVQEALDTLVMGSKTTILIAHRAAMMKKVDNILVMNGGQIVEQGTHDSLVARNGMYVKLMQPKFAKGLRHHRLG